jgi:hypothetical protein
MRTKTAAASLTATIAGLFCWSAALAADQRSDLAALARTALADDSILAADAASSLRQAGPEGMEALLAQNASGEALDRVCGVRDCADIRLFWYTDLEAAKAAARAQGKPILSLRLMGRLDEEFSCANSRFFRTVFYKNREINTLLREGFVLHWRSVRPVPKVTIDFGDGSRLERTLTGNSIHYVLDSRGRLIEALPGLYGPAEFRDALRTAAAEARYAERLDDSQLASWMSGHAEDQLKLRAQAMLRERARAADPQAAQPEPEVLNDPIAAGELASSKSAVEVRVLRAVTNRPTGTPPSLPPALASLTDDDLRVLADFRRPNVRLDAESRAFLLRKQGVTDPVQGDRLVDSFEQTIALDEAIDEYRLRPAILLKLSDPKVWKGFDLEAFNLWLYENVFRTPLDDPWLGLAPDDVYGALPASARTEVPRP